MPYSSKYNKNIDDILRKLEELYKNSILEDDIQNNNKLTAIFVNGQYSYYPKEKFTVSNLAAVIELFKSVSEDKRKIILNNLWERFDKVQKHKAEEHDDLPF